VENRVGVACLCFRGREAELDRARREPQPIAEGEELLELRALDPLRRHVDVGEEPVALAPVAPREAQSLPCPARARDDAALEAPPEVERIVHPPARTRRRKARKARAPPARSKTATSFSHG
jgi:hypothetical protein